MNTELHCIPVSVLVLGIVHRPDPTILSIG